MSMTERGGQGRRLGPRESDLLGSWEREMSSKPAPASNWLYDLEQISSLWALVSTSTQGDSFQPYSWGARRLCISLEIQGTLEKEREEGRGRNRLGKMVPSWFYLNKLLLCVRALKPRRLPLSPGCGSCLLGWSLEDSREGGTRRD